MALVDDDEVEEAGRELAEQLLALLRASNGLIETEINLVCGVDPPLLVEGRGEFDLGAVSSLDRLGAGAELRHCRAERPEVVDHRLVDQDVPVGKEKDPLLAPRLPQPPDDLKSRVSLARASRHDEKDPVLPLGDRLDSGVDGIALVVAGRLAAAVVVVVLKDEGFRLRHETLPGAILSPEVGR